MTPLPFNPDQRVLVVAEIGNNHEGDAGRALELVQRAAEAGADAVKFQTFQTELFVSRDDRARFDRLKGFELSPAVFERLADAAHAAGLLFLSTPLDLKSVRVLEPLVDAFKIASGDNTFYPLIEAAARTCKPIIISSGLVSFAELQPTLDLVRRIWAEHQIEHKPVVLHCVTGYPVPDAQANLGAIHALAALPCIPGYSDHTIGIEAAVLSVALGARVIEKHFTLNKMQSDFRDHQLSADPADFAELVRRVRLVSDLLGSGKKCPQPVEQTLLEAVRRSISAVRNLPAGARLESDDLAWLRPGTGLPPGQEGLFIGHRLTRAVAAGEVLKLEDVD